MSQRPRGVRHDDRCAVGRPNLLSVPAANAQPMPAQRTERAGVRARTARVSTKMRRALPVAVLTLAVAGCGGGDDAKNGGARQAAPPAAQPEPPASADPAPRGRPAPEAATKVIRRWADTLRAGDEAGAARIFALPSLVQIAPGGPVARITMRSEALTFQRLLPCGAKLISATARGRYADARFRLSNRPGGRCDAPGATAGTRFLIRGGRIVEWRRLPDAPPEPVRPPSNATPEV